MSQNIYLNKSNWNYWFNYNNSYYGIYDENKFINMFLPFLNVNKLIEYNEKITNSIVIHDIQSDGIFDNKNINIMLCIENCKFWNYYNHINKYGEFGNDKISIYLYNHINKLIISSQYIAIPVIYLQIDYYQKYHNSIQPNKITSFDKKKFCLIVSFDKKIGQHNDINSKIEKIKKIGQCDSIKDFKNLHNSSCYHSLDLLNVFNSYKFIICFENSWCNGYITEKPFNAIFANTIPIYCGSPDVHDYFNKDRFIDLKQDETTIINKIISLGNNEKLYKNYIDNSFINKSFDNENYIKKINDFIINLKNINIDIKMKKVLSFSLWGEEPKYTVGAVKNAILAKKFYPSFECWFYIHKDTVPDEIIKQISELPNTKIILKTGNLLTCKPMCWRFEAIDDDNVEVMMPRDTDTRIFMREKMAVDEWLKSDKKLHIMRDHKLYHNQKIFGGMFGIKKITSLSLKPIIDSVNQNNELRNYDLYVLNKMVQKIDNNSIMVHSPYNLFPNEIVKDFPIHYSTDNYNFVGCYVFEDDSRVEKHHKELM